ncbi:DUF4364 family protein [Ruminococcus sp.]|uniref:DUF4364 family protein n=1 Tax=Ruminococcus sp. TaxID=41978 RepID=UPI002E76BB5F|nr:DUF4364 family protein [Ruminococcus sp.]MEE1263397.1 DUF4364 family protein [Ruminococcus sp.]
MAFDTFDEGIALGGLRSKHEIKVLMCYLFNSVKDKMSESVITEAIREYELANFFEVKAAFDELKRSDNLTEDEIVDGEQTYRLTENGRLVAEQLESTLAYSVKEKALRCAIELLAERKTLRENFVDIVKTDDGFQVNCRVLGGETDLFSFTLYAPDEEMAEQMKKSFLSYPVTVYKTMLALMTKNREAIDDALEDIYSQD